MAETPATDVMLAPITVRATYDLVWWEDGNAEPVEAGGYTDPENPWRGEDVPVPAGLCGPDFLVWRDRNVDSLIFLPSEADELVDFVRDFPGAVWDAGTECEAEQVIIGDEARWRQVTLHLDGAPDDVARIIERAFA